jgi:hypothetical protein
MIVTGDFETYYSKDYNLRKMSIAQYVLDPRFQVIMLALKINNNPSRVYIGYDNAVRALNQIDWSQAAFLAHNNRFDGCILAWRFGIIPKLYLDTLSMARAAIHSVTGSSSLDSVSKYFDLPPKGTEVVNALGYRLENFTLDHLARYARYCVRDNENCWLAFNRMHQVFSAYELQLIDLVLRMYLIPQVQFDPGALNQHLQVVQAKKAEILQKVQHVDPEVLRSNVKFEALLESYGIEAPRKLSLTTGQLIPAFAKGDPAFKELCQDDTLPLEVQAILAARIGAKSTIEETRTQRLLDHSLLNWNNSALIGSSWAPIPLKYSGAKTHRLSGDEKMNWQNLVRGSMIRAGVVAPPGYRIVHRDASQIEARMVAWLAGCRQLLEAFAQGRDVYSEFAGIIYGRVITKADTLERFVGKTGILGLGYGCGGPKFRYMLFIGNGGISVRVTEKEALYIVLHYRSQYPEIPELWRKGEMLVAKVTEISRGYAPDRSTRLGSHLYDCDPYPVVEPSFDALTLPSGLRISYPNIRVENNETIYDTRGGTTKIYGGKLTENVSQALSRIILTNIAVRVYHLTGYHPFLSTHDSLDYCVPETDVEWWDNYLQDEFSIHPNWAPDIPLASEGGWGRTLLDAEKKVNS